jgi:hypothetical protein
MRISKFKISLLVLGMAVSFLVGYAKTADAWPVYGRSEYYGYFKDIRDSWGDSVWHTNGPTEYAVPLWINTADEFINFTKDKLNDGPGTQNGIGAAFIIQTMIGSARNLPPTAAQITEWESRVRYAYAQGLINWNTTVSYSLNTYYQGPCSGYNCDQKAGDANPRDDAFYDTSTETASAIVFRHTDGSVAYMIRHLCANPIGTIGPLSDAPSYALSGSSSVSDTTVIPGQTITFTHRLTNSGPNTATGVRYTVFDQAGATKATGGPFNLGVTTNTVNTNNFKIPNNSIPGTKFCQYVHFTPLNQNGGSGNSAQACATVIADFELTPTVTASTTAAQQNDSISFTYQVFNPGPTPSTTTTCKIVGNNHGPGYTPLPQQDVDRNSDPGYVPPATPCPTNFLVPGPTTVATETVDVGNLSPGSRICRSLVVNPKNESGGPRASAEACVVIAKTPYVHFQGNDVWAGGGFASISPACNAASKITTSAHALKDGSVAGSGVEYAAFALGKITNFGSAGKAIINPAAAQGKMLTFSNVTSTNLGFYGAPQHCINDYISTYSGTPVTTLASPVDVNNAAGGTWQINGAHTFHGNVPNKSQQVYLVNGDVTIDNDIKYSDSYDSVGDIPSLVIIATGNIFVQSGVKQMDGLYVAHGTFNTCSNAPAGNLSINDCKDQLVVNGSVIAGSLTLLRTYGADGGDDVARKNPAEIFNFSPEMYLRSALNGGNSILRTVDEKDLPPRY